MYSIENQFWDPRELDIKVGDSVYWTWIGSHFMEQVHNESSEEALFATHGIRGFGTALAFPAEYFWTFTEAGTFHYICLPHLDCCDMRGVIRVTPRGAPLQPAPVPAAVRAATATAAAATGVSTAAVSRVAIGAASDGDSDGDSAGAMHATHVFTTSPPPPTAATRVGKTSFLDAFEPVASFAPTPVAKTRAPTPLPPGATLASIPLSETDESKSPIGHLSWTPLLIGVLIAALCLALVIALVCRAMNRAKPRHAKPPTVNLAKTPRFEIE